MRATRPRPQSYRAVTDGRVKELEQFRLAFRPLKDLYAETRAADFGPRALKAVRKRMIEMGWTRRYINDQVNRIRHVFKWAAGGELVPGEVLPALQAVPGLRKGRGDAPECEPVTPVPMERVAAKASTGGLSPTVSVAVASAGRIEPMNCSVQ